MWAPSQWDAWNPLHDGLMGCKLCRADPPKNLPGFDDNVTRACGVIWHADGQGPRLHVLAQFFERYLSEVPKGVRKALSHIGALQSFSGSPVHWLMEGRQYFDPGNKVYHWSMLLLFPNEDFLDYLNEESVGDLCEGFLAFRYRKVANCQFFAVRFFEAYCSAVWQIVTYRNINSFAQLRQEVNANYGCPLFASIVNEVD